jgi:hypothetical protein
MIDPAQATSRLGPSRAGTMSQQLAPLLVVVFGGGVSVAALVTLVGGSHRSVFRTAMLALALAVGVFIVVVLLPFAYRARGKARANDAFMEADVSSLRLIHPPDPPHEIDRGRVTRAEYTYRTVGQSPPMSVVSFYDHRGDKVATWSVYPLVGRRVAKWLGDLGIATTVDRRPR